MDGIKAILKNFRILHKIHIVFMPLVLLPILIIVLITNYIYYEKNLRDTKANMINNAELVSGQILSTLWSVENCANVLNLNINYILEGLRYENSVELRNLKFRNNLKAQMNIALEMFNEVGSITYVDRNDLRISSSPHIYSGISFEALYQEYLGNGNYVKWLHLSGEKFFHHGDVEFYLLKLVVNIDTQEVEGILILTLPEAEIERIYHKVYENHKIHMYIADDMQRIVSSADKDRLLTNMVWEKSIPFQIQEDTLIGIYEIRENGWVIISEMDLRHIRSSSLAVFQYIIFASLLAGGFALWMAHALAGTIVEPIQRLKDSMLAIYAGNLEQYLEVSSHDEVGILSGVYNKMLFKINTLLEQIKVEQNLKREYELALMQTQIKPHFLYNTLDLVYVLISLQRMEEAKKTTKLLADFFRLSLSSGQEIITLSEELKLVSHYLEIQKYRYSEILDYSILCEEEAKSFLIPKLSLQPLIENSIYHGLKQKTQKGEIRVLAKIEDDVLHIVIKDNGVGMDTETLSEVLEVERKKKAYKSFGIFNVNRRFLLYYGERYAMHIESDKENGTEIHIQIQCHDKFSS